MPIGVVYGAQSGIVRRIILPDSGQDLQGHVGPGEALLMLLDGARSDVHSATAAVAQATGKTIPSSRCEILDADGKVMGQISADPLLDRIDGYTLRRIIER